MKTIEVRAKTEQQDHYLDCIDQYPLTFATGPAGTGKTFLAVAEAVNLVLDKNTKYEKIIIVRPAVEAGGEQIGFLPGRLDEKMAPYMVPILDSVKKIVRNRAELFIKQHIEIAALAFMRGRTFENAVVLFDEAQNATPELMLMFLTRLGNNCKAIVTGDPDQHDMRGVNGLSEAIMRLSDSPMIGICRFTEADVVRSKIAKEVLRLWEGSRDRALLTAVTGGAESAEGYRSYE